jgi:hypothetical protein
LTNATALGNGAIVNASNKTRIGNAAMNVVETQSNFFIPSDARFKTNVKDDVKGLEFISKLRPVVYNFDTKKFTEFLTQGMEDSVRKGYLEGVDFEASTAIRQSGFLAQEVELAAAETGYNFNGLHKPAHENDNYSIAYSQFVVPLVKATQELNAQNEAQTEVIDAQKALIDALQSRLEKLEAQVNGCCVLTQDKAGAIGNTLSVPHSARLDQNAPNPFQDETVIRYFVTEDLPNTFIRVVTLEGNEIGRYPILEKGEGQISISGNSLSEGLYLYELYINGEKFATRKMVLTR